MTPRFNPTRRPERGVLGGLHPLMTVPPRPSPAAGAGLVRLGLLIIGFMLGMAAAHGQTRRSSLDAPIAPLRITERGGELGLRFDYLSETQRRDGGDEVELSNRAFQEYLIQRIGGYVYHPRFLEFRSRFEIGMMQQFIENSGLGGFAGGVEESSRSNSFIGGYDLYLHFLKEHPFSAMVFAGRDRRPVLQLFTDRQIVESERYGVVFNWKKDPFPMDLALTRTKLREFGFDSHSESDNTLLDYVVRHRLGRRMETELRYRLQDYQQSFTAENPLITIERETELQSHDLSLLNTIYLNEDRTSYLSSILRYFTQTGSQELATMQWHERLNLRHTPNFSTYYLASLLENEFSRTSVLTRRLEAGLDHRLYRSLDSHLDIHGRWIEFDESEETEIGVTGRLGYRKQTPWGYLTAGYGRTLDRVTRTGLSDRRPVIDEAVTLDDVAFTFLSQPAISASSVQVTDATGVIIYLEGFDYELEERGNRLGIRRLATGNIDDGETVLVDYSVEFTSDLEYLADHQIFHVRYDFERFLEGLAVYYRWQDLTARDAPRVDDFSILEYTDWLAGLQYRWRWLTWSEEFERYESNFSSYDQLRSQIEGHHPLGRGIRLGWHAGTLLIDYRDEGLDNPYTNVVYGGLTLDGRIRPSGFWQIEARARKESGLSDEMLVGIAGKVGMIWRKLKLEAGARVEQRQRFESERDRMQVFLQVTREF